MKAKMLSCDILPFVGKNILEILEGTKRDVVEKNMALMKANYGNTVDSAINNYQVLLCNQTHEYLYSDEWKVTNYEKGSRPQLESLVFSLVKNCNTQLEKVLAIMRFCRDLYKKTGAQNPYDGGREEELIEKGEHLCECLSRLCVAFCEIENIPARIIMHIGGGHLTNEICIDGEWGYFDTRAGMFFIKNDGKVASVCEILDNPDIIYAQPDWVKKEASERWTWDYRAKRCYDFFFDKREVNTVKPYSLSDENLYSYAKRTFEEEKRDGLDEKDREYEESINRLFS